VTTVLYALQFFTVPCILLIFVLDVVEKFTDMDKWSVDDVSEWLKSASVGMEFLCETFKG